MISSILKLWRGEDHKERLDEIQTRLKEIEEGVPRKYNVSYEQIKNAHEYYHQLQNEYLKERGWVSSGYLGDNWYHPRLGEEYYAHRAIERWRQVHKDD